MQPGCGHEAKGWRGHIPTLLVRAMETAGLADQASVRHLLGWLESGTHMDWLWTFLPPKPSTGVGLGGPRSVTVLGNTQRPVVPIVSGSQPQGLGTVPGLEPIPFDTSPLALFTEEGRGRVGFHPGAPLLLSTPLLESPTITLF